MPAAGEEVTRMTIDDGGAPGHDPWAGTPPSSPLASTETPQEQTALEPEPEAPAHEPRRPWPLGYVAFGIAVLLVILEGIAVYLGSFGEPVVATVLGQVLVVITAFPFALGLLAVIRNRNREWGIAAMVLSVIANPFILINVLGFFGAF
jgi:hypothetical protein